MQLFISWWHRRIMGHIQENIRVSPPGWDPSARGLLRKCECGEEWAW